MFTRHTRYFNFGMYQKKDAVDIMGDWNENNKKIDAALAVSIGIGINIKSNDLVKKWAEAANEVVEPEKKEPEPVVAKVEMPDIETQLEIAKITAERDVYKRLYEEAMARR